MFLTNTGWTQNCATLVNLIYAFVKYIFIFLASVNKSNIFECILHIFISSSWIKHSFKKSHPRRLCDCLCIMDLLVLLLRKGHKWVWFQVRWSSENINFIRILSLLGKKGFCCCPLAGWVPMQKDTVLCILTSLPLPPNKYGLDYTMCIWTNSASQKLECLLFERHHLTKPLYQLRLHWSYITIYHLRIWTTLYNKCISFFLPCHSAWNPLAFLWVQGAGQRHTYCLLCVSQLVLICHKKCSGQEKSVYLKGGMMY